MAFFCTETGIRIAQPGVHKSVDPVNGHDEVSETQGKAEAPTNPEGVTPNPASERGDKEPPAESKPSAAPHQSKPGPSGTDQGTK